MKRTLLTFAVFALLISNCAYATIYTYTGENFDQVYGDYTTGMNVTGTIVTSSPIPPNSVDFDISPILTSWSFNDGMNTISSSNGKLVLFLPEFSTDAQGNIIKYFWAVANMGVAPVEGDPVEFMSLTDDVEIGIADAGFTDVSCTDVIDDVCTSFFVDQPFNYGSVYGQEGTWVTTNDSARSVPTLSQWSLILLALLLGMVGVVGIRRKA